MVGKNVIRERPSIDVVTLTWNDDDRLDRSIEATLVSTGIDVTLTVVDNASSPAATVPNDDRVRVIRNASNRGVRARNQGVGRSGSAYVAFIDSDACVHPETLATLVANLEDNPDAALAVPVFDGQAPNESAGTAPTLARKLARLTRLTRFYAEEPHLHAGSWDVDFAISACWVFRREVFTTLGGLDEAYFYGPEDVDFCLRVRLAGWRIIQVAAAGCDHAPRRRFRSPLSGVGARHTMAVIRHLWRFRHFHGDLEQAPKRSFETDQGAAANSQRRR